jgi:adenosylhomocysteinase
MSEIKSPSLAHQGRLNIELAESNMKALLTVRECLKKEKLFKNLTIGLALHVTKETAVLVRTLTAGGAQVAITGCNPLSTQDDVAAALAKEPGVEVFAYKGESKTDYYRYLKEIIKRKPHITIDDGCDLVTLIHTQYPELISTILGGCEETTTGVIRLKAMEQAGRLKYPMVAVNDNLTKHLMDNYYGTGQSTFDGILRATNTLVAGKTVVVAGYGSCGKGVSLRARGLSAEVVVTEVDPFRALQARMDGFRVLKMAEATKIGDIFITVTGNKHAINLQHMLRMKDGAILANSGHFDHEIDVAGLKKSAGKKIRRLRPWLDEYVLNDKRLLLCGEGRLVNLAAAEGHPSEVMSLSFCGQALACEFLVKNRGRLENKIYALPPEIDDQISRLQLKTLKIEIDTLTPEQKKYLSSWEEGT